MINEKSKLHAVIDPDYFFSGIISYIATLPAISKIILGDSKIILLHGAFLLLLAGILFFNTIEEKPKHWWKYSRNLALKRVIPLFLYINVGLVLFVYIYKYLWLSY